MQAENTISSQLKREKENNFAVIKFVAAILVIFSHAFPIALGSKKVDPISHFTGGQISLGNFAVCIFLLISGFFITKSMIKVGKGWPFLKKRIMKIVPPLFLVVFFTAFLIGPFVTNVSFVKYITDPSPYMYVIKNTILWTEHHIIGVFTNQVYFESINGSLWTLPVEFLCYIGCLLAYQLKLLKKERLKYTVPIAAIVILFQGKISRMVPIVGSVLPLILFFYIGMLIYVYKDKIKLTSVGFWIMLTISIVSVFLKIYPYTKYLCLPYLIFYIGYYLKYWKNKGSFIFELSYEIYLLAFLVQQLVCFAFGGEMNPYLNFLISTVLVLLLSYPMSKCNQVFVRLLTSKRRNIT